MHKYLHTSDFLVRLLRKSLAAVQFSPAVEAALFEVFHQRFVHPLLQQRELGGGDGGGVVAGGCQRGGRVSERGREGERKRERRQRKGIGKAGEEINGSVQEE